MCGIAGAWSPRKDSGREALEALGRRMGQAIAHRGPDDSGTWADPAAGVVLAHRRLSILDLSPEGHQPMVSADGRWVLAFNGEIYNHHPLRQALAALGHRFNGHSDTEVLLAAIAQWGVHEALERGNGMLALAAWDRQQQVLWLARDRVGKKPLYYGWAEDGTVLFGSELSALRAHPRLRTEVDPDALALLLRLDYIRPRIRSCKACTSCRPATCCAWTRPRYAAVAPATVPVTSSRGGMGASAWKRRSPPASRAATRTRSMRSMPCCAMRSACAWRRTCRWVRSSPVAPIPRWSPP